MLLSLGTALAPVGPARVLATHDPVNFTISALFSGWNSTLPPGTLAGCSPTGTAGCNPTITEFRGEAFTVKLVWKDLQHNFAIYTKNFPSSSVSTLNACSLSNTNGCLAKAPASGFVSSTSPTALLTFAPNIPPDDFTGPGGYEYYCQLHPTTMHGKITVLKSPDLDGDGSITILDIAPIAFAFDSTPASPNWNIAADIDNSGKVDVADVAQAAFLFGKTL